MQSYWNSLNAYSTEFGLKLKQELSCTKKPTHLMDVYSFGVILLELIAGKPAEQPASDDSVDIDRWVRRRINVTDGTV
ncbi:hypothetical protein GUJ93_ZPchr0004g38529 [Zizania palustris]|uniref:Serine-threonine/tyrosine-protein kinase catalytic domain-containing protein n=1 Tax=Zizania palustris TaxID=103762 RepID=A0A8J5RZ44_ZIZPA|nr:hypothetical protein GUJ93_ZPchr0004g38529 [Zizania palustris]